MDISLTIILIIFTCGISIYAWQNPGLTEKLTFHPVSVRKNNEWYRFISSGFLHADWGHLFFNMFSLYFFGEYVEMVLKVNFGYTTGTALFFGLYILGIIISDIPTYIKNKTNYHYHALGASGGVSTIIFAGILFNPISKICLYFVFCLPGFVMGILYLFYSAYEAKKQRDNINHDAHLYGALFGIIAALILIPGAGPNFIAKLLQYLHF